MNKVKVAARILMSFAPKIPQITNAICPLANKAEIGGSGTLVCIKKIEAIPEKASKKCSWIP